MQWALLSRCSFLFHLLPLNITWCLRVLSCSQRSEDIRTLKKVLQQSLRKSGNIDQCYNKHLYRNVPAWYRLLADAGRLSHKGVSPSFGPILIRGHLQGLSQSVAHTSPHYRLIPVGWQWPYRNMFQLKVIWYQHVWWSDPKGFRWTLAYVPGSLGKRRGGCDHISNVLASWSDDTYLGCPPCWKDARRLWSIHMLECVVPLHPQIVPGRVTRWQSTRI